MSTSTLFQPLHLAGRELPNRIVMAPLTRARSSQPGDIPNPLMAEYYAQRASAGLIVSEATQISPQGQGYSFTPGIYSAEQVNGWRQVTTAVHGAGGRIYLQLWHVGRMSHASFHADGLPVAPSALAPDAQVWVAGDDGIGRMLDCPTPRELSSTDIAAIIEDYRRAARNADLAGFDGVEIHGANGYLIDQFLRSTSNQRTDAYGGSRARRLRFFQEVVSAVAEEIGAARVGVRLAPFITARNMACPDIIPTILEAAAYLDRVGVGYLHLSEADWDDAPQIPHEFRVKLRAAYHGVIIVAGRYTRERGEDLLQQGLVDLIAFGRPFIGNPDLVERLERDAPLHDAPKAAYYGGGARGYTDFPTLEEAAARP